MPEGKNNGSNRKGEGVSICMSEIADLYITISRKSPRPGKGFYIYVLEGVKANGERKASNPRKRDFEDITPHKLELNAIVDGLKRFKRPCRVNIHSDHGWFKTVRERGWFEKWQQAGWIVNGHEAAGADLYQEIHMLETICNMEIGSIDDDLGSFSEWFKNTMAIQQNGGFR